jgi:hypothetical protein
MSNRSLVRTDFVNRVHVLVDVQARKYDSFVVELLEQRHFVEGATVDEAWSNAMQTVAFMRTEYAKNGMSYPPSVFSPFATITAVEFARESAKCGLKVNMLVGTNGPGPEPDAAGHEDRVRSLCKALDQIDFLRRPKAAVH